MQKIAIHPLESQEKNESGHFFQDMDQIPGGEAFYEFIDQRMREFVRLIFIRVIEHEFEQFIGVAPYERSGARNDYRNGVRLRDFETAFGVIKDIPIPRVRHGKFFPSIFQRWERRHKKITKAIANLFILGISTRKIKKITKAIFGRDYSAATASRCNKVLQEDFLRWMNRPIAEPIRYLFLDAINLKLRRHWISKESLLCAIGITEKGTKTFLGFILGGRESTASWESLLLMLKQRGLCQKTLTLVTVDGNAGLLKALNHLLPKVPIQRCIVHKIRNIVGKCPRQLRSVVPAEAKQIFYATSKTEAVAIFNAFKAKYQSSLPGIVELIEKDLEHLLAFYDFPFRHWAKIRSTNVIERAFKEFRRRIKIMETFPNEQSCLRIMFSLAKMLNENWKYKPIKDF